MDPKVYKLLNDQINKEFYSAYLYLEIANYYDAKGLDGFANWYEIQAKEEQDHAMLFYRYLHNNSQPVVLEGIARPETHFTDLTGPLKAALGHEQYVTGLINAIYAAAAEARDYRTVQFLDSGRGGEELRRPDHQDGAVRRRRPQPVYAEQRAAGPHLHRPVPDVGVSAPEGRAYTIGAQGGWRPEKAMRNTSDAQ